MSGNQSYNDFLAEVISESYRENGAPRQPNPNNSITQARYKLADELEGMANESGGEVSEIAESFAKRNRANIERYVAMKGEIPASDLTDLCVQANNLRNEEIAQFANILSITPQEAELYLEQAESNAVEISSPEADSFLGEIGEIVRAVAGGKIQKAADKHLAKKGKAGFIGGLNKLINGEDGTQYGTTGENLGAGIDNTLSGQNNILGSIYNGIVQNEKQKQIKKMLPIIIIVSVLIIVLVFVIARKTAK